MAVKVTLAPATGVVVEAASVVVVDVALVVVVLVLLELLQPTRSRATNAIGISAIRRQRAFIVRTSFYALREEYIHSRESRGIARLITCKGLLKEEHNELCVADGAVSAGDSDSGGILPNMGANRVPSPLSGKLASACRQTD